MREIVFDTETTGLDPAEGHRVVQIGAVELDNFLPTGRIFEALVDPGRPMDPAAQAVHGLSDEMLSGKPAFAEVARDFLDFVEDAPLIAHNAEFDMKFLNFELEAAGHPILPPDRFVDTLEIARRRFPGQKLSLDALCRRFGIDNSMRERHDALLDCRILAQVYLELRGGRQQGLGLTLGAEESSGQAIARRRYRAPRPHAPTREESAAHEAFVATIENALWRRATEIE